jgi:hypothetical protein
MRDQLKRIQRECLGRYLLAERPCSCVHKLRAWYWLGIADYLMEEVLIELES